MSKHPIDHDRARDDAKVAQQYSRIEREQAGEATDPKVRQLTKDAHKDEGKASGSRVKKFVKIEREQTGS